ncbi:hypothetical protein [Caulobacter sp.]|uniref:hypothetical protein n=1 Tax=Caulobacter sp. TaxID=78 RepID=UPI0016154397
MAYTYEQLTKAYAAVHGGIAPNAEVAVQLQLLTNASFTDADRLNYILNSADDSTAVAVMTYQFFTGKSPKADGIAWLLNSADNKNDLNDAAFANFNLEHRFMNFAASLALSGEGKAAFEAKYASLTYAGYVASIYDSIIGNAQARAAGLNPEAIVASVVARQDLILASARAAGMIGPNATAAEIDLALKTATAAYLLAEGIKADVGVYAAATNNFMVGLAKGDAVYNTDITQTYAPNTNSPSSGTGKAVDTPPPVQSLPGAPPPPPEPEPEPQPPAQASFVLTTGIDKFTGTSGADTFTGTHLTYQGTDVLDGGAGIDTLTITASPTAGIAYYMPNDGFTGIEVVNVTSDGGLDAYFPYLADITELNATAGAGIMDLTVNATATVTATSTHQDTFSIAINGGSDISLTSSLATTGQITIGINEAPTGDVVVSREQTGANVAGTITVNGGKTVSITQTAVNPSNGTQTNGAVTVNGSALTTEVTVKAAQAATGGGFTRNANSVTIGDTNYGSTTLAGTISKVAVDGYTSLAFNGSGLTDLSLAHGSGNVVLRKGALAAPTNTELNLALNGLTGGMLQDFNSLYRTLNVTTGAQASTLGGLAFGNLQTLDIQGASTLTIQGSPTLGGLQDVKVSGAAGLNADLSQTSVTLVDTSASTGTNTLKIDASQALFTGGAGVDNITLSSTTVSQSVTLGGGDNTLTLASGTTHASINGLLEGGSGGVNTLKLDALDAAQISNFGTAKFYGFQTIELTAAAAIDNTAPINLGMISGIANTVRTQGGNGLTLTSATSVQTLELTGAGTSYNLTGNWAGANDTLAVKLQGAGGSVNFAFTGITAAGIETVNITSNDINHTGNAQNWLTWLGNDVKTITASGDGDLNLTASSTALTTVDASGLTQGDFQWSSVGLTGAATIKGSATGTNTIDMRSLGATGSFTYTGGTGADLVTFGVGNNTINLVADSAVDKIIVGGGNTGAAYTTVNGLQAGDQIVFDFGPDKPHALTTLPNSATLADYLAAGSINSDGIWTYVEYFTIGSDTYLIYDRSSNNGFQDNDDVLIKLVGVTGITSANFNAGTGTLTL